MGDGGGLGAGRPAPRRGAARRAWRRFALLGTALFLVNAALAVRPRPAPVAPAGGAASDEEVLVRQALARGYQETDPVVRRRLAMNLRFALGADGESDQRLAAQGVALGMHETDLVVRRRLAERIALEIEAAARAREPDEAELRAWYHAHLPRFTLPARVHLRQIPMATAEGARAWLIRLPGGRAAAEAAGIALPLPREVRAGSRTELARLFGGQFADAVFLLPTGRWSGPIASPYAVHLVLVEGREPARPMPFAAARSAVRESLLEERAEDALRRQIVQWRRGDVPGDPAAPMARPADGS
jgi:parvulin-like peptidyl-prolyl isomerase